MRLFSLLPMTVAAILFAGSVSAHHRCDKSDDLGKKVYEVCKSWRTDQEGPMPEDQMQNCRNILCQASEDYCAYLVSEGVKEYDDTCVAATPREKAKEALGYWN